MMPYAWSNIGEVPYCFSRSSIKFQGHRGKNADFDLFSRLLLQFESSDGFEMMHKAWYSKEEVSCYFSMSSIKYQGHTEWKNYDLNQIWV